MKKKGISYKVILWMIAGLLGLLLISNIVVKKQQQEAFEKWSVIVAENFQKIKAGENEIYAQGKRVEIPKIEYDQMVEYYKLNKLGQEEVEKEADAYVKERYAVYAEAIEQGYTATEEDIESYMQELKEEMEKDNNKTTVETIKKAFGSEETYWEYEKNLSKIDIPVKNYINALAKEYESIKNELVEKEQFKLVNKTE